MPIPDFSALLENALNGDGAALDQWFKYTRIREFNDAEISKALKKIDSVSLQNVPQKNYALFLKAIWHQEGIGVAKDLSAAIDLYQKASKLGHPPAKNNLGYMYEHGIGVAKNIRTAIELYQQASNLGNPFAKNNLGYLYEHGIGV